MRRRIGLPPAHAAATHSKIVRSFGRPEFVVSKAGPRPRPAGSEPASAGRAGIAEDIVVPRVRPEALFVTGVPFPVSGGLTHPLHFGGCTS